MSDPPATIEPSSPPGGGPPATLTPDAVAAILGDFRAWLENGVLSRAEGTTATTSLPATPGIDLFTLVGQFTALRHEVNLQTKATRAAVEQNAEVLRRLETAQQEAPEPEDVSDDTLRPVVKAFVDIADALSLSLRQMEKLRDAIEPMLDELELAAEPEEFPTEPEEVPPPPRGFFARLFGSPPPTAAPTPPPAPPPSERSAVAVDRLRQLVAAAADGYAMSLRRVGRVLPTLDLEPLGCVGELFDPELMEVVEVVGDSDSPTGTVVEEVRPGYLWRGKPFRFAQVKVAR